MKSTIEGEVAFPEDEFVLVSEHASGSPIKAGGVATKAGIWIAGGGDVRGKRVWRSPEVVERAVFSDLKNFYAGNHPVKEDDNLAAGKITSVKFDPSTQAIVYEMDYFPEKGRDELTEKILGKVPVPNSVKSRSFIDWTPGMVDGKSFDGRELSLELLHVAEVPVGACNPEDGCGIGLHCSCDKKISVHRGNSMIKAYEGDLNPAVIDGFLSTAEKLEPEERANQALAFLMAIGAQAKNKVGMFLEKIPSIEVPKVTDAEHGAFTWEPSSDLGTLKPAIESVISMKDSQIATLVKDLATVSSALKVYTDAEAAAEAERRKGVMEVIAEHSGFSAPTLKTLEGMKTDDLVQMAKDMKLIPEDAAHHSWEDLKNMGNKHVTTPMRSPGTQSGDDYSKDLREFYATRGMKVPKFLEEKYGIRGA